MPSADWRDILNFNPVPDSQTSNAIATVTTLTPPAGSLATKILVQAVTAPVRFTLDGTDPVADTTGFLLAVDQPLVIAIQSNTVFKFLANAGTLEYCWGS